MKKRIRLLSRWDTWSRIDKAQFLKLQTFGEGLLLLEFLDIVDNTRDSSKIIEAIKVSQDGRKHNQNKCHFPSF